LYRSGTVTHPSRIKGSETDRSLPLRAIRADLYKSYKAQVREGAALREAREAIVEEGKKRDRIETQYLQQSEVVVTMPDLGKQHARLLIIEPEEINPPVEQETRPPVVLIGSISSDVEPSHSLIHELAHRGKKVIVVGYPESSLGQVTEEFAQAAEKSETYEPHITFFKTIIEHITKEDPVELWGVSTGCPIIGEMLMDEKFRQKVASAVLLAPASSIDQSQRQMIGGTLNEFAKFISQVGDLAKWPFIWGRKKPQAPEQGAIKNRVFNSLTNKVCHQFPHWDKVAVREGGKIVVWSGGKDQMTKSYQAEDQFSANPQITVVHDEKGTHTSPFTEPPRIIDMVEKQH
jgi:hypothetical protein